nr:sialate O-acetylesterase [uncultured Flavobacterium sp.]
MKKYLAFLFVAFGLYANANVTMPSLFNDGMVLQRSKPIAVWGWADSGEKIEILFNKQTAKIKADKSGKWLTYLKPEAAGGPFKMVIKGKNTITINDILVGEVWICSGQSNMEFTVGQVQNAEQEIKEAGNPFIRQFLVQKDISTTPKLVLKSGSWQECTTNTAGNFTAVGYFFAKKIYAELKIPVGIINSSWGGTCSETWTSREAFEGSDEFKNMIAEVPKVSMDSISQNRLVALSKKIESIQGSKVNNDGDPHFKNPDYDDSSWPEMYAPKLWENQQLSNLNGVVWMRKSIVISKEDVNKKAILELAKIDDQDITYVNGIQVGTNNQYDKKRIYEIPAGTLKAGVNVIAVRISDYSGGGGIFGEQDDLKLSLQDIRIPLAGQWKFQVVEIKTEISPNSFPDLLYNAMINPLIPYTFQGVLWYQGEANCTRAEQYKKAFPLLINDWRKKWYQGDFPFYFVQLSSFDEFGGNSKTGSRWAELREAQSYTAKTVPNSAMCVTIDIGDTKDIHPKNKQHVGRRLAAIALNKVYGQDIVFNGPYFKSMEVKDNQIILTFDNLGSGLMTSNKYNYLKGFEIAGSDKIFHYAKAYISNNKVIVFNENVLNPVVVHYGWADDAGDCNLYNTNGFPASPFRTDTWQAITKNVKYQPEK